MEQLWWDQWIVQVFPNLVPYKRWKTERRNPQPNDIVLILYDKKVSKGEYRLGRILRTYPDTHGVVRTVVVGMRGKARDRSATYTPQALDEYRLGVQRIAVICPVEEQNIEPDNGVHNSEQQQPILSIESTADGDLGKRG